VLRAVAVVHVPVDDRDPPDAPGPEECRRYRHVVEEAEAHGPLALGVVTRRADECETVPHLAREDRLAADEKAAGGEPRRLVGVGGRARIRVEDDARPPRRLRDVLDVRARVHERELVLGGGARGQPDESRRVLEVIEEHLQTLGALGMAATRVVRQHARVRNDGRTACHGGTIADHPSSRDGAIDTRYPFTYAHRRMFGIGMPELIVILVVALVVLGPKRLPEVARTLGKAIAEFRRQTSEIVEEFQTQALRDEEKERPAARTDTPASLPGQAPPPPDKPTSGQA